MPIIRLIALLSIVISAPTIGDTVWQSFTVEGVMIDSRLNDDGSIRSGGCIVRVSPNPADVLAGCGNYWLTMSCSGVHNSKSEGNAKYSTGQLAYVANKPLVALLNNQKLHNGLCYAEAVRAQ